MSSAEEFGHLVDDLCTKFGATKATARSGAPYAREVDLVAIIRSLDGLYRKCIAEKDESITALQSEIADLRARVDTLESRPFRCRGILKQQRPKINTSTHFLL